MYKDDHWYPSLAKNSCWLKYPSLSTSAYSMNYKMSLSLMLISRYWLNTAFISLIPTNPFYFRSNSVNISRAYYYLPLPKNHFFVIKSTTSVNENVYLSWCTFVISSYISLPFILVNAKLPRMLLRFCRLMCPVFWES